jgi:hypothetical protein
MAGFVTPDFPSCRHNQPVTRPAKIGDAKKDWHLAKYRQHIYFDFFNLHWVFQELFKNVSWL